MNEAVFTTSQGRKNIRFGSSAQSDRNSNLAMALVIFLSLAPIPLGSNRPVFWGMSAFALAAIAIVYFFFSLRQQSTFRHKPAQLKFLMVPYLLFLGFIALQLVPFGEIVSPISIVVGDAIVASKTMSLTPGMSMLSFIQFSSLGILFFLVLQVAHNTERAHKMLVALFGMIVVYGAYSLFALHQLDDPLLFIQKLAYRGYATGTFINRNSFATFLSFGMVIGSAFTVRLLIPDDEKSGQQRNVLSAVLFAMGTAIIFAALISTQSRMGFVAGATGALITVVLVLSNSSKSKRLIFPVLFVGITGAIILFFLYGSGLLERVGSVESAADVRLDLYKQVLGMIADRPWTGFGAGSFELAFPLFHQLPVSPDVVWDKAHNTYLALWSELGIVFGSIPILLVILIGVRNWQIFRSTKRRWMHASISLGVITTAAIHSTVDFSLEIHAVALLFVAILAIGMSGPQSLRNSKSEI